MAYARRSTKRRAPARRSTRTTRTRSYATSRRSTRSSPRRRASVRRPRRAASGQQTLRLVIQTTGPQPEARPSLQTALLGEQKATGPKKARAGGGH